MVLVSMPGVPQEMTTVMSEEVIPRLCAKFRTDAIIHHEHLLYKTIPNRCWLRNWNLGKWHYLLV